VGYTVDCSIQRMPHAVTVEVRIRRSQKLTSTVDPACRSAFHLQLVRAVEEEYVHGRLNHGTTHSFLSQKPPESGIGICTPVLETLGKECCDSCHGVSTGHDSAVESHSFFLHRRPTSPVLCVCGYAEAYRLREVKRLPKHAAGHM